MPRAACPVGYHDSRMAERLPETRHRSQKLLYCGGANGSALEPGLPGGLKECQPQSEPVISGKKTSACAGHMQRKGLLALGTPLTLDLLHL